MNSPAQYKPSAYYFRCELRAARTKKEAVEIGLHLCLELETLKQWVRDHGMIPPKWHIMQTEVSEKQWGDLVKWPKPD